MCQFRNSKPLFLIVLFAAALRVAGQQPDLDTFGGWKGKSFEATGYFRMESGEDRWWLVSPEGNGFLIHGMDHCGSYVTGQSYNKEYWNQEWGLKNPSQAERTEAFYNQKVAQDRDYLGFNSVYSHQAPVGMNVVPYLPRARSVDIEYWRTHKLRKQNPPWSEENFLDVFSDAFVEKVNQTAQKMQDEKRVDDPWLLAWLLTDSPVLVPYEARPFPPGFYHKPLPGTTTWPVRLRNLGASTPGKQAYVELMRSRYGNRIQSFNAAYNTAFDSWEALAEAKDWRSVIDIQGNIHEERDNHAFLLKILDKSWGTQVKILQARDPNHMIWGDTLNMNSPITDDIIRMYAKHFPVIVYQYYGATWEDHERVMDRFRRLTNKPIFSADSSWSVPQPPEMPDPLGPQCANYEVAADRMEEVYNKSFARPDFIGWGWCGWMDQWESAEPVKQHGGLQDAFGNWHQPLADRMAKFGKEMYSIAQP
ncbi:MAG: hypothetical protein P8L44_06935 [Opitutales bacterium]|jgi:hypothetical protein|nr:hypothetical protein [Opitutales bacterium]